MLPKKFMVVLLLISVLLLGGCVNLEVNQELKRNGNYDIELKISTPPEYKMALDSFKENLQVAESVKDKFQYEEDANSMIYSFKNIDPSEDKRLFKKVEKEGDEKQFSQVKGTPDTSFLSPKNINIKKEFDFPHYKYTYELKTSPDKSESSSKKETLSKEKYIIDKANILEPQSEDEFIKKINNIYQNDSIETIVVTKKNMTSMDFVSYKYDFIRDFDFRSPSKEYIMIFMSTNEDGLCKIKTNVMMDARLSSKIRALDKDFSENCKGNYSTKVKDVLIELNNFFQSNDIKSSSEMGKQIKDSFNIGYTVKVFGKIVETNGLRMNDNKVKFEVAPSKQGVYKIVFKDFFLISLLGEQYWIYLIILGIIIAGVIGSFVYFEIEKNKSSASPKPPLAVDPRLVGYVKKARAYGMSDEQIRNTLLQSGWNNKEIEVALNRNI